LPSKKARISRPLSNIELDCENRQDSILESNYPERKFKLVKPPRDRLSKLVLLGRQLSLFLWQLRLQVATTTLLALSMMDGNAMGTSFPK